EINNNKVHDRAIGEFNQLKEAYSSLYKQNQRLIAENEPEVQDFLPNLPSDVGDLLDQMPPPLDNS
ncbi:23546_t:CDS:2, partial [Gigaspora margarita]